MEDRIKRIEAEIFPYEKVDTEMHMHALAMTNPAFIIRYEKNKNRYIQIVNFLRHQAPNKHEKKSDIPPFKCNALSRKCNAPLIPDVLIPESLYLDRFEQIWQKYPKKHGKDKARNFFIASVTSDTDWTLIEAALKNYMGSRRVADGFAMDGSRWFQDKEWRVWIDFKDEPVIKTGEAEWMKQ